MSFLNRSRDDDESELWSSVSDLFGAMSLIFLVLFLLTAALVGDRDTATVRAEMNLERQQNAVLQAKIESLEQQLKQLKEQHKKTEESIVPLSAVEWAIVMKVELGDAATSRYELLVVDPLGGQITNTLDKSAILSNRGASWISVGAEQIVAQDSNVLESGAIYAGTYKVRLIRQKGNERRDSIQFKLGKKTASGGMELVHQQTIEFNRIQAVETTSEVFEFDVDAAGKIGKIRRQ